MYEDESSKSTRPSSGATTLLPPPGPSLYRAPDEKDEIRSVNAGKIWSIEDSIDGKEHDIGEKKKECKHFHKKNTHCKHFHKNTAQMCYIRS